MSMLIKICGLYTPASVDAALEAGADLLGFVFFSKSPRNISFDQAAILCARVREKGDNSQKSVALTVNADDALLSQIVDDVQPDFLQLHGNESPERVAEIKTRFQKPLIKAIGISSPSDLDKMAMYEENVDYFLLDTKPPASSNLPGGNGIAFDWTILEGVRTTKPYLLAGGLTIDTVAKAVRTVKAQGIDLSSGVESAPGVKDNGMIHAFIKAARDAHACVTT